MARGKQHRGGRGGGGGRGRGRGKSRGGGGGGGHRYEDNRVSFDQVNKHNEKMERFYNTLNIVPDGPEREAFWAALRRELPNSFRFTGSKAHAKSVKDNLISRYFPQLSTIQHEGKPVDLPYPMEWYPEKLAYAMTTPKNVIRKYDAFKDFQKFLVSETSVGKSRSP
jgi:multisite-specific tRNA:(cytosine-C5)-methyltransferase